MYRCLLQVRSRWFFCCCFVFWRCLPVLLFCFIAILERCLKWNHLILYILPKFVFFLVTWRCLNATVKSGENLCQVSCQRQPGGHFWEMGWSTCGFSWPHRSTSSTAELKWTCAKCRSGSCCSISEKHSNSSAWNFKATKWTKSNQTARYETSRNITG